MTAAELFEALRGVPEEALYAGIDYVSAYSDTGQPHWRVGFMPTTNQIAAALQRDAMTEWLILNMPHGYNFMPAHGTDPDDGYGLDWYIEADECDGYPTRLHALAAACKYVKEQEGKQ